MKVINLFFFLLVLHIASSAYGSDVMSSERMNEIIKEYYENLIEKGSVIETIHPGKFGFSLSFREHGVDWPDASPLYYDGNAAFFIHSRVTDQEYIREIIHGKYETKIEWPKGTRIGFGEKSDGFQTILVYQNVSTPKGVLTALRSLYILVLDLRKQLSPELWAARRELSDARNALKRRVD